MSSLGMFSFEQEAETFIEYTRQVINKNSKFILLFFAFCFS